MEYYVLRSDLSSECSLLGVELLGEIIKYSTPVTPRAEILSNISFFLSAYNLNLKFYGSGDGVQSGRSRVALGVDKLFLCQSLPQHNKGTVSTPHFMQKFNLEYLYLLYNPECSRAAWEII